MTRWRIAAAAAGFLAACIAIPVQAGEWCLHDPPLNIQTSPGNSFTVYVTEGVLGSQHQATLASAKISYATKRAGKGGWIVTVYDYIPTDSKGSFATEMLVSTGPFGSGYVFGSAYGKSGSTMKVSFWTSSTIVGI